MYPLRRDETLMGRPVGKGDGPAAEIVIYLVVIINSKKELLWCAYLLVGKQAKVRKDTLYISLRVRRKTAIINQTGGNEILKSAYMAR